MTQGQQIGYVRVSSAGQNEKRQLVDVNLNKIFTEKVSGKNTNRPKLQECIEYLREGDTLNVHSMDRLARNLKDLQEIVDTLIKKGVKIHFHKENLTFKGDNSSIDNLLMQVMGAVSEFERNLIKERQIEGIKEAKKQGKHLGRSQKLTENEIITLKNEAKTGVKKAELARKYNISRTLVYNYLKS